MVPVTAAIAMTIVKPDHFGAISGVLNFWLSDGLGESDINFWKAFKNQGNGIHGVSAVFTQFVL